MNKFHEATYQANLMYGIEIPPEDAEEIGLIAYNKIGNKRMKLYRYCAKVSCDNTIELPCNCEEIEAITYDFEDWNYTSNIHNYGDWKSNFVENYNEYLKVLKDKLYQSGRFVHYERVGDIIYLDKNYGGKIFILYYGEVLDDDGLPELTDKEVEAVACFIAYVITYKKALKTMNNALMNQAIQLKRDWASLCDAARIPYHISQNEMNEILDAKTSWNRKVYGKSLKPLS